MGFAGSVGAFSVYTDRLSWEQAMLAAGVDRIVTDTFDNNILNANSITFDTGVVSTGINGNTTNDVMDGFYFGEIDSDGDALFDPVTLEPIDVMESITWTFPHEVIGFGADFYSTSNSEGLQVSGTFDGIDFQIDFLETLGNPGNGFLGIVGNTPIQQITFQTRTDDSSPVQNEFWVADNLSFGTPKSKALEVPERSPNSVVLILGVAIAGCALRKNKRP